LSIDIDVVGCCALPTVDGALQLASVFLASPVDVPI
jgi:hypothetical protein